MTTKLRAVLIALLAAWLAMPTPGGEGGENAGGTGVWILPAAAFMTSAELDPSATCRGSYVATSILQDVQLELSGEMGTAVATCIDPVAGTPVALPVSGSLVRCPAGLLQALAANGATPASMLITDASQRGYIVRITIDSALGQATFKVY